MDQLNPKKPLKTLVISDIHNHTGWVENALTAYKEKFDYDEVVFLGDYFDDFGDNAYDAGRTAIWLKASLHKPNRIHLIGNHDIPYMIPSNDFLWCPGFTPDKCRRIRNELTADDFKLLRPAYFSNDHLLSHAGFTKEFTTNTVTGIVANPAQLIERAVIEMELLKGGLPQPLFQAGYRMATGLTGGITWCDWDDEFEATQGINQIVGHTPHRDVRMIGLNYDLDTSGHHVMLLIEGQEPQIINNYQYLHS